MSCTNHVGILPAHRSPLLFPLNSPRSPLSAPLPALSALYFSPLLLSPPNDSASPVPTTTQPPTRIISRNHNSALLSKQYKKTPFNPSSQSFPQQSSPPDSRHLTDYLHCSTPSTSSIYSR
ncbi:hypothetical protein PGTUg99_024137 [Puccinia graminis f. sp. tritici]|uniref:Uncharacterized protein n=1 Tax=Puccinia graminis f. sp. tritici TaxID=56615 RepID=A0A5B0RMR8_PUCGR|nr:hypothetical protein PGTUg99_024137 [Puccinia graminis f. sp. tritici]